MKFLIGDAAMLSYLVKRIGNSILVLWVVMTVTFFLMHAIPGGPFTEEKSLPPAVMANIEARYKLNDPLITQYQDYLINVLQGDLGPSFKYVGRSVNDIILESFPVSLELGLEAILLALFIGVPAGVYAAYRRNGWQDRTVSLLTTLGVAVPSFVLAALLVDFFAMKLSLLPAALWNSWASRVLPAIALAAMPMAFITRLTRSSMLDVLGQDYIRTARAKGVPEKKVISKHAFRNTLIPLVTTLGGSLPSLFSGALITETLFSIRGIGYASYNSMVQGDIPFVMFYLTFISIMTLLGNLISDLLYAVVDPRVRLG